MFFKKRKSLEEKVAEISERDGKLLVKLLHYWNEVYNTYIFPSRVFKRPIEIKRYEILLSVPEGICVSIIDEFNHEYIADVPESGKIQIREE